MIQLSGIARTFQVGGRPVRALRGVDLTIEKGEYVSIMGPSGSGKSTLLNILGCLDRPTSGSYRLEDQEVADLSETELSRVRRHKIGFVFQFFHLVARLSALENVELPMLFAGMEPGERREQARETLVSVGLAERADHRPDQLSGGERQRVAIARAVVLHPSILLADEPTGNLDTKAGGEIVELIETLNEGGITLIVVTHDPEIGRRAHRRIRLSDGGIAGDDREG
ncbi:MAG: ATP-binding cassette domain-containing protein [Candidatus Eisenbacteria bacterium]|nr:ATP-binding cassette domain-containing protein [Candidatus Latescibacterota bacterium]MBD3303030.1 ATP-binding cassette domain-containing protein [Candidatus Eisenbacteria bacterium]